MHAGLEQHQDKSLLEDARTVKKLEHNFRKNKEQDHTRLLDAATGQFNYAACANEMWNPERFSLLYATPLWDGADTRQRVVLNQLYWVAYYSQIISAEIATIFFNQTAASGLDEVYPSLILANAARQSGIDAFVFFTFWGLDAITTSKVEHLHLNLAGNGRR